jgi:hypothetical protein
MTRNLKALGLALVAVFAMSAVAASAASAQSPGTLTSDGPVTLTVSETGAGGNYLMAFGLKVECPGSTMTGHKVQTHAETTHAETTPPVKKPLIPNGATEATLTPKYSLNCIVVGLNWPATVTMNGCDYNVKVGETTGAGDTYGVSASLKCPTGAEATVDIWTPGKHNGVNPPMCTIHFSETNNQNKTGPHLTDTTNDKTGPNGEPGVNNHVDIQGIFTGITATKTASAEDPILCPHAHTATAELAIHATIKGDNEQGEPTGIGLKHP